MRKSREVVLFIAWVARRVFSTHAKKQRQRRSLSQTWLGMMNSDRVGPTRQ